MLWLWKKITKCTYSCLFGACISMQTKIIRNNVSCRDWTSHKDSQKYLREFRFLQILVEVWNSYKYLVGFPISTWRNVIPNIATSICGNLRVLVKKRWKIDIFMFLNNTSKCQLKIIDMAVRLTRARKTRENWIPVILQKGYGRIPLLQCNSVGPESQLAV